MIDYLIAGHYNSALSKHKRRLAYLTSELNSIAREINSNELQAKDLESKCLMNEIEIKNAEEQVKSLKTLMEEYEVLHIIHTYIHTILHIYIYI